MNRASLKKNRLIAECYTIFCRAFGGNRKQISGGANCISIPGPMKKTTVTIYGKENIVSIKSPKAVRDFTIFINGSNNNISIEEGCLLTNLTLWIEDNDNKIYIKKNTLFCGKTQLDCIEGTSLTVGSDCLFADNIHIRTGDSHSVLDMNGCRINPSKDIALGNHIWIGANSTILKGVTMADNSIVGNGSIVTKPFEESNVAVAGNPARVIKSGINWSFDRKK